MFQRAIRTERKTRRIFFLTFLLPPFQDENREAVLEAKTAKNFYLSFAKRKGKWLIKIKLKNYAINSERFLLERSKFPGLRWKASLNLLDVKNFLSISRSAKKKCLDSLSTGGLVTQQNDDDDYDKYWLNVLIQRRQFNFHQLFNANIFCWC